MNLMVCYPRCGTCKKAIAYLRDKNIEYTYRDIKLDKPSLDELKDWYQRSGLPIKRFFNTSGALYKEMNLKDKVKTMSDDEILKLLSTDGLLVKRPIFVNEDVVLVGFKIDEWEGYFNEKA